MLAERMKRLSGSQTSGMPNCARKLRAEGVRVVNFAAGELDQDTSPSIKQAARQAIDAGRTQYTDTLGITELRERLAQKVTQKTGIPYAVDEVGFIAGAKQALFNATFVVFQPDDEVIIPAPYWVTFPEQVRLAGATPVFLPTEHNDFQIDVDELATVHHAPDPGDHSQHPAQPDRGGLCGQHPGENSPPGSAARSDLHLRRMLRGAGVCRRRPPQHREARSRDEGPDHTGGFVLEDLLHRRLEGGDRRCASACHQGHGQSPKPHGLQCLQHRAIRGPGRPRSLQRCICGRDPSAVVHPAAPRHCNSSARSPVFLAWFPTGAFYLFPDVSALLTKSLNGQRVENVGRLAELLLEHAHIAVVPGSAFGSDRHLRISYAIPAEEIVAGLTQPGRLCPVAGLNLTPEQG